MRGKYRLSVAAVSLFVAACAGPQTKVAKSSAQEIAREAEIQRALIENKAAVTMPPSATNRFHPEERLSIVANRLLIAGASECQSRTGLYPVTAGSIRGSQPMVAESVGALQAGDLIVAMDGLALAAGQKGTKQVRDYSYGMGQKPNPPPITYTVQRDGKRLNATFAPVAGCAYPVGLVDNKAWNAATNGKVIIATTRLENDLKNDHVLAVVIGHELAHAAKGHVQQQQKNMIVSGGAGALVGALLGNVIGMPELGARMGGNAAAGFAQMTYSADFEREADNVGLRIAARAGYDVNAGEALARHMGVMKGDPSMVERERTHPSPADRAVNFRKQAEQLKAH